MINLGNMVYPGTLYFCMAKDVMPSKVIVRPGNGGRDTGR